MLSITVFSTHCIFIYFIPESKFSKEEETEADSDESTCSEEFNFLEKRVHEFFHDLKHYDMTPWDVDSVYKLISNLADLKIKEFDDFNIALSMTLGEMIRHWRPEPSNTAELFLRLGISSISIIAQVIIEKRAH